MTVRFTEDAPTAEELLGATEKFYALTVMELERTIAALSAGEFNEVKAAQTAIRDLRVTALQVLQERGKVDQLRKQIAGHVGAGGALKAGQTGHTVLRNLLPLITQIVGLDLHRFRSGHVLMLGGPLFEGHG